MSKNFGVINKILRAIFLVSIATVLFSGCNPHYSAELTLGIDTMGLEELVLARNINITPEQIPTMVRDELQNCEDRICKFIYQVAQKKEMGDVSIQRMSNHRFRVQLTCCDEKKLKEFQAFMRHPPFLEFQLTHPKNEQLVSQLLSKEIAPDGYEKRGCAYVRAKNYASISIDPDYVTRLAAFEVPDARYVFMLANNGDGTYSPNYVMRSTRPLVTGEDLVSAAVERDPTTGQLSIGVKLSDEGGRKMLQMTRNYKPYGFKNRTSEGRQLAIILDGQLISAPTIQSAMSSNVQITGRFDAESASKLADEFNVGAGLPPLPPMIVLSSLLIQPDFKLSVFENVRGWCYMVNFIILRAPLFWLVLGVVIVFLPQIIKFCKSQRQGGGAATSPCETTAAQTNKGENKMKESNFTGGLLGMIGIGFLCFLLCFITFGLGGPWAVCIWQKWLADHTVVDGKQMYFDGTGGALFVKYIVWFLLCIITFGIYSFWLWIKMHQWVVQNTHLRG